MKKKFGIRLFLLMALLFCLSANAAKDEVIPVTIKSIEQLVFHPVKKAPAQVVTLQNSLLSSEVSALVKNVHVQIGDQVLKNQLLISLECDDFELAREQQISEKNMLIADQQFANYQYERSKKLIKSKSVSQEAHRKLGTEVAKLSAQRQLLDNKIKQSEKIISRCQIKAPFSGVISERLIHVGEHVAPHTALVRLIDVDNLEVEVQVPIVMIDNLDYTALNFIYRNKAYPLKLRAIIPSIETRARHQRVRLTFLQEKTLPDAYGMVEITLRAMHIPANYLVTRKSKTGIFIIKDEIDNKNLKAHFHPIKNAMTGRAAIVGLPMDTRVVISGRNALTDGQLVSLKKVSAQ